MICSTTRHNIQNLSCHGMCVLCTYVDAPRAVPESHRLLNEQVLETKATTPTPEGEGLHFGKQLDFFFSPAITHAACRTQAGRGRQRQGPGGYTLLVEDMSTWQNGHMAVRNEVFQAAAACLRTMGAACLREPGGRRDGFHAFRPQRRSFGQFG